MSGDKGIAAHEVGMDAGAQDDRDMERLGKVQEFKVRVLRLMSKHAGADEPQQRNFRFYSILGFTTTLMATWESILL